MRVLAGAVPPLPGLVADLADRIAEPAHQPAQEQILVLESIDGVDHRAVEQQEIGAAGLHLHVAERAEHAIIEPRGRALEASTPVASSTRCAATILKPPRHCSTSCRHQRRRMLEIRIHHDDRLAARMAQPARAAPPRDRNCA